MNIFRRLRWQLTLSYTLVTVCVFLVITMILGGVLMTRIFIPTNLISVEKVIYALMHERSYNLISQIVSASPVDTNLLDLFLKESQGMFATDELLRIGAARLWISANASVSFMVIGYDGTLLATSFHSLPMFHQVLGGPFDPSQLPGLEAPYQAAMTGVTDPARLYTMTEPNKRMLIATPLFDQSGKDPTRVVGVLVIDLIFIPTEEDLPAHILKIAGRSLVIFLLGAGIMGALFGAFFAHGLSTRFKRISAITDQWSAGNFSRNIGDATGDEIAQFTRSLDEMARQLQSLLRRRQDMAVSEERNRLARDLHDSAKQQALAASLELGAALALFERDLQATKKHLVEADALVDSVRKELTNLVDELRPQPIEGLLSEEDFPEVLQAHALEWARRSNIELDIQVNGTQEIQLALRETLYRILQEALANIARHSSATRTNLSLELGPKGVTLIVEDNGRGFDLQQRHGGVGLTSMRERAEAAGGSFAIQSAPEQGVKIVVTIPLENAKG